MLDRIIVYNRGVEAGLDVAENGPSFLPYTLTTRIPP
jgi:hypothetical protein